MGDWMVKLFTSHTSPSDWQITLLATQPDARVFATIPTHGVAYPWRELVTGHTRLNDGNTDHATQLLRLWRNHGAEL